MKALYVGNDMRIGKLSLTKGNVYTIQFDGCHYNNPNAIWVRVFYEGSHRYEIFPYSNLDSLFNNWAKDNHSLFLNRILCV